MVSFVFALKRPLKTVSFKKRKMQMKMINLASVSRKKSNQSANDKVFPPKSPEVLHKIEDFNNIVVMSGTATRKPINKKEKCLSAVKIVDKNSFEKDFFKLRAPAYKSHHKQMSAEEKLMNRSCEILFECIRPYKDIRMARKPQVTESETIGSLFKTNAVICERKATRKIQLLTFSEEIPSKFFLWDDFRQQTLNSLGTGAVDFNKGNLEVQNEITSDEEEKQTDQRKTVSSEDFIIDVFSEAGLI